MAKSGSSGAGGGKVRGTIYNKPGGPKTNRSPSGGSTGASRSTSGGGSTSTNRSTSTGRSTGGGASSARGQLTGAVSSGMKNTGTASRSGGSSGSGGGRVTQTAQGLGYYGNNPTLSGYYNNLADLYNNDKAKYNATVYDRTGNAKSMSPNMGRDTGLAGQVVAKGGYAVYYNDDGYATKAVKIGDGDSVRDLNNSGWYTGAQRTWSDLTGKSPAQTHGSSGADIFRGLAPVGAAAVNKAPGTNANAGWLARQMNGKPGAAAGIGTGAAGGAVSGGSTDFSDLIRQAMASGADADYVQQLVNARNAKIAAAGGGLDAYYDDDVTRAAQQYVTGKNNNDYYNQLLEALTAGRGGLDGYGGGYSAGAGGGGAALAGSGMTYEDYLDASGFGDALDSIEAAKDAYLAQLQSQADRQASRANEGYDDAARQAYIAYMQSRRTLPQRMSAAGMNGGLADSQEIALETGLQNNQAQINLQRQSALQEIQNALLNGKLAANQEYLGTLAGLQQDVTGRYQNYAQQQQALNNENYWNERDMALQKQQYADSMKQRELENDLALMQILGYSTDPIAARLGIASGTPTSDTLRLVSQMERAYMGL